MRKRQVKKFAKGAKKNMAPYRQARNGGSKKLRRRMRAFNRAHHAHDRHQARRLAECKELLEQIGSYEPRNEKERLGIAQAHAKLAGVIERREAQLKRKEAQKRSMREVRQHLRALEDTLMAALNSGGGWNMVKVD